MLNYSKYALVLENTLNETADYGDTNSLDGIARVLSGKDYEQYQDQWLQFVNAVKQSKAQFATGQKNAGDQYWDSVQIKYADGKPMVYIGYCIGKDGKIVWDWLYVKTAEIANLTYPKDDYPLWFTNKFSKYSPATHTFLPDGSLEAEGAADETGSPDPSVKKNSSDKEKKDAEEAGSQKETGSADSSVAQDSQKPRTETADSLSQKIIALFKKDKAGNNSSFWKAAAKDEGNDFVEEDKAIELFNAWWNKNIEPHSSKLGKCISMTLTPNVSFDFLKSTIVQGLNSLNSPAYTWTVNSSKKTYSVDTDLELEQYKPNQKVSQSTQNIGNSYNYGRIM
jgi:hypothetical protein